MAADPSGDRSAALSVERWFRANARELPWRAALGSARDPYHALVCETMAQQTQIARVAERFVTFLERFPTVGALAQAKESDVLAVWSGLGYYRRAINLHRAAQMVESVFAGRMPEDVEDLLRLPGVGRYTAGAIASIACGKRRPILDGNVARLLIRLAAVDAAPDDPATVKSLWDRADDLVRACDSPALLNEGLMELGATVCTPAPPECGSCPLSGSCAAHAAGLERTLPRPKAKAARRTLHAASIVASGRPGHVLVEQRPSRGMWASMWQAPTLESETDRPDEAAICEALGCRSARPDGAFVHKTTHRDVRFEVWRCQIRTATPRRGVWVALEDLRELALSRAQQRILLGD